MSLAVVCVREVEAAYEPASARDGWIGRSEAHDRLVTLAQRRAADDVAMLEPLLIAEETGAHELLGLGSFQEYCARLFGWGGRQTRERLRVARAMRELPRIRARWAKGELTYSVVRELTRVATPEVEREWLTWATGAEVGGTVRRTAREVQRVVVRLGRGSLPTDAPLPFEEQTVRISLQVSGSEAARFAEVRAVATRRLGESVDDETLAKMLFDAFLRGGEASADPGEAPNQVQLTVCERCGATERQAGAEGLVPVAPAVGEVALCDARVLRQGQHATQTVPPARRREVLLRDEGTCAAPGCRNAAFTEVHHVHRRADGGGHDPANLVTLCSVHHAAAHEGRLVIRSDDGMGSTLFRFERADGHPYGTMATTEELSRCSSLAAAFEDELERTRHEGRAREDADRRVRLLRQATGEGTVLDLHEGDSSEPAHVSQPAPDESTRASDSAHVSQPASDESTRSSESAHVSQPVREETSAQPAHVSPAEPRRPLVSRALGNRVVGLLTAMGYSRRVSTALVEVAITGSELPRDRSPTTEELLRAALRCG